MMPALSNAERQIKLLEAAARVGHAITSRLDPETLFGQIVDIICDTYGFYYAGVFLIDPHQPDWAILRAGRGELGHYLVKQGHRLKIDHASMIGWCIDQKQARITSDVYQDQVHKKVLPETRSEMALPLMVGGHVIGALTIQSAHAGAFANTDVTSLQAMADQLAVAIENARLLAELDQAQRELARAQATGAIASAATEAIRRIGDQALAMVAAIQQARAEVERLALPQSQTEPLRQDLTLLEENARLIVAVQEGLTGSARVDTTQKEGDAE